VLYGCKVLMSDFLLPLWELFKERFSRCNLKIKACVMLIIIVIAVLTLSFLMNRGVDQIKQNDESALIETSDHNQSLPHVKSERSSNKTTARINNDSNDSFVYVDIKGSVQHTNVYKMSSNDSIKEWMDKAIATERDYLPTIIVSDILIYKKIIYVPQKAEHNTLPL